MREERDIIADSDQEARGTCMVAHFDLALDQLVRVQEHQLVEIRRSKIATNEATPTLSQLMLGLRDFRSSEK